MVVRTRQSSAILCNKRRKVSIKKNYEYKFHSPSSLGHWSLGKIESISFINRPYCGQINFQRCPINGYKWRSIFCIWRCPVSSDAMLFSWYSNKLIVTIGQCKWVQNETAIWRTTFRNCSISWNLYVRYVTFCYYVNWFGFNWKCFFSASPFCYIFDSPIQLYFTFRAFYIRYCYRLTTISTHPQVNAHWN